MKWILNRGMLYTGAALLLTGFLSGCVADSMPILFPKGPIALAERNLIFIATAIMLLVLIPVYIMIVTFLWRYREHGGKGEHSPEWGSSPVIETFVWGGPTVIIIVLGYFLWVDTHKLNPYKALMSTQEPFEVNVIGQDWKWLFLYPEQGIATVNELAFPSGRPLRLKITSDTVMNSFIIPALGGQIYAMAGMTTQLHLLADEPGRFRGRNYQYSGDGYADQFFYAIAMTDEEFSTWESNVKRSSSALDAAAYAQLRKPSVANPITYFSSYQADLFQTIISKYAPRDPDYSNNIQLHSTGEN